MSAASVLKCPMDDRRAQLVLHGFSTHVLHHQDDLPCGSAATEIISHFQISQYNRTKPKCADMTNVQCNHIQQFNYIITCISIKIQLKPYLKTVDVQNNF